MKNHIDVSIIISTFNYNNRLDNLNNLLISLKKQKIEENINFEIIIVDNGCSLDAKKLVKRHKDIGNMFVVQESRIGLSNARNKGILSAVGEIIAFIDDDITLSEKWLSSLFKAHFLSDALCVGGQVIVKNNNLIFPKWFSDYFLRFLLPPNFSETFGVIYPPFYLIGANMSFKKVVFQKYGLFDTSLGRKGGCLLSGEDTEFILRLNNKNVYYDPGAIVFTDIRTNRLTRRFFLKRIFWQAVSDARIFRKHGLSRFYDAKELFFSAEFVKIFLKTFMRGYFFELSCIAIRFLTFKFFVIGKL